MTRRLPERIAVNNRAWLDPAIALRIAPPDFISNFCAGAVASTSARGRLALEFVLADNEATQKRIAQNAASELQNGPSNTNPVARWVEAVQPWMPGQVGDNMADEGEESTDWTARAKGNPVLCCVFRTSVVDHKAGIMASASALSRIAAMKSFQPQSGNDIIQKVCALKEDFPRQLSKTRLEVYKLFRQLISNADVASDLQYRHGAAAGFMNDLLQLCRSERDPDCLMVWFEILRIFLQEFSPSQEILEEVYGNFKAYFPITLPRTSQSAITPEELKLQLRNCFSSNQRLAPLVFPFLVGKLDQGDGVTVNVKVDVLRTIKACLDNYAHPEQSVTPYVNQIWGSLKYEVRNGEIEDTIWATLEVLKSLATRLKEDDLRDYSLTVTRDCVNDLSNPTYTSSAGRLIISVLSANARAFVLMAAPTITHIKDNLRHPKSPLHTQDLLKILHVLLETRILLVNTEMSAADASDFGAVDAMFKPLYEDVYRAQLAAARKENPLYDDLKTATQAVQGAGALVCQQSAKASNALGGLGNSTPALLLPESTCSDISDTLFAIVADASLGKVRSEAADELVNETTKALERVARTYTSCFKPLVNQGMKLVRDSWHENQQNPAEAIQNLCLALAFVGCSELPQSPADGLGHFLYFAQTIMAELLAAIDQQTDPSIWCSLVTGLQSAARYFNDACLAKNPDRTQAFVDAPWVEAITQKYPSLTSLGAAVEETGWSASSSSVSEIRNDFLLIGLYIVKQLYQRATRLQDGPGTSGLILSQDFANEDVPSQNQYLHLISGLAGFIVHELSEPQQLSLQVERYAVNLFHEDSIALPQAPSQSQEQVVSANNISPWSWLVQGRVNILSIGILEALRPSGVSRLVGPLEFKNLKYVLTSSQFDIGIAQELVYSGAFSASAEKRSVAVPVAQSIVTILTNKFKIETLTEVLSTLNDKSIEILASVHSDNIDTKTLEQIGPIFAIANGMLRRGSGKDAKQLLQSLREGPKNPTIGHQVARRFELLVAPQDYLTKDNYAVVKPLWMQKVYFELVKPMLQRADGLDAETVEPSKTNYGIAVLSMLKHMDFSIFEDDAASIVRVAILIAQNTGPGPDTQTALETLRKILPDAPEKLKGHLQSLIKICVQSFSANSKSTPRRADWLPKDYEESAKDPRAAAACGKLSLEILGAMPQIFDAPELLSFAPQVGRELTVACGHHVRDVRKSARLARAAWANLK
ncbi:MMS19 nucleotide excision repair protein [Paramyrothecium foliicola]|nr:MMS19 nucleotide excision repair protein [Paramyrothecium foliicola]